jgi:Protein of unknown function (DUF1573)
VKIIFFSLIALAVGIAAGLYTSYREFEGERLPTKNTLAVLAEKGGSSGANEGPKVVVEGGEIFDFGTMDRGSKGHHDFVFRNVGTKPLVLTLRETTCKCTIPTVNGKPMEKGDKLTIAAGGSHSITLEWGVKTVQANYSQSAEFETTDLRREIVKLLIYGKTVDAIELEDASISFSGISANEPATEELVLFSHRDQELKITKQTWQDSPSKDFLEATFSPLSQDEVFRHGAKGGLTMRVSLKPGLPLGVTNQTVTLRTNYEGIEPQVIPVTIRIVGDISVLGPRVPSGSTSVALGSIDQNVGMTHTVYLHIKGPHRDMTDVQIESIEPASLLATLEKPLTDSPAVKRIPLKIEVPAGVPLGNFLGTDNSKTGKIVLKTTHPDIKQIVIPVLFVVR